MIRNYTSGTPVDRSVNFIEKKLVEAGARHIAKQYDNGALCAIVFSLERPGAKPFPIKLPANVGQCERILLARVKRPRKSTGQKVRDQAERTAWKLLADWVDIQVAMIKLGQVEALEIFLPYMFNSFSGTTFYQELKASNFKALSFTPE